MLIEFTPELVAGIVGAALSWLFSWFPGLRTWYAALKPEAKSGIMLGMLLAASVAIYLLAYYGVIEVTEPITWFKLLSVFFAASMMNQTTYLLTPQPKDVKVAEQARNLTND